MEGVEVCLSSGARTGPLRGVPVVVAGRAGPTTYIPGTAPIAVAIAAGRSAARQGRFCEVRGARKKCRMRVRVAACTAVARPDAAAAAAALPGPPAHVAHDSPRPVRRAGEGRSAAAGATDAVRLVPLGLLQRVAGRRARRLTLLHILHNSARLLR